MSGACCGPEDASLGAQVAALAGAAQGVGEVPSFLKGEGFPLDLACPRGAEAAPGEPWPQRLALVGPMGVGKTTVGPLLAKRLGWAFEDLDALVERMAGRTCADIVQEDGEPAFRHWEAQALATLLDHQGLVLACGGGAPTFATTRQLLRAFGPVARLDAPEALLWTRAGLDPRRPLAGDRAAFSALLAERAPLYASFGPAFDTTSTTPEALSESLATWLLTGATRIPVPVPGAPYEAWVAVGGLSQLPRLLPGQPRRLVLAVDGGLPSWHEEAALVGLEAAGWGVQLVRLPPGDAHKDMDAVLAVADAASRARLGREGPVVALGGGMVGDVAGFAAALHMRGVPWVQVPTTLLGMIDAGIGGKVACNRPAGKNLLGAFHQPSGVLVDPSVLGTLPALERRAGLGEMAKYALIGGEPWLAAMEADANALAAFEPGALLRWIPRAIAMKAAVVAEDPTERPDGPRTWLNLGHTLGHAIEREAGYGAWPHGLAVAVGIAFAAWLAEREGRVAQGYAARTEALLKALDLPCAYPAGLAAEDLVAAMGHDKKNRGKGVRFVLPQAGPVALGSMAFQAEALVETLGQWREAVGEVSGPALVGEEA